MKQKTYYGVLLFINKTVDGPNKASRHASISCRRSEDDLFLNVEEKLINWRTGPYHQLYKRSVRAGIPLKMQTSC